MAKFIRTVFKIDTLSLCECNDGYYIYDTVVGMNISMRAKLNKMHILKPYYIIKKDYQ